MSSSLNDEDFKAWEYINSLSISFLTAGKEDLTYRKIKINALGSEIGAPERLSLRLHDLDPQAWLPPSACEDCLRINSETHYHCLVLVKTD